MPDISVASSRRWPRPALLAVAIALLTVLFYAPANAVLDATLDASNYGSYSAFTAEGRQFGQDVVPMAGPYGFVMYGTTYSGHLYWLRFTLELLTKAAFASLVVWFFCAFRGGVVRWLWLASLFALVPGGELVYDFTVLLAGLFIVINYERPRRVIASCAAVVLLAFLALAKGTMLVSAFATLGLVAVQAVTTRDFRRLGWLVAAFGLALLGFWLAAEQHLANFPSYVHGINQLSTGYNGAMGLQEPARIFATGLASLLLYWAAVAAVASFYRRRAGVVLAMALLGGFGFIEWKHGFVRADGHVYLFYFFCTVAVMTVWLLARGAAERAETPPLRWRLGLAAIVLGCLAVSYYGPGGNPLNLLAWQATTTAKRVPENLSDLLHARAIKQHLGTELRENRGALDLPDTRAIVGRDTIDFFGIATGYVPLNRFNYAPRPMSGGSYNVFTPELQRRNERFVTDPATRPEYFLVELETIDNRLQPADDALTLRALVQDYVPVAAEQGLLLLHARPGAPQSPMPRVVSSQTLHFGETVATPTVASGEMLLVAFEFPPTLQGRLRSAIYKPSAIFISLAGDPMRLPDSRRLVPSLAEFPLLLSPLLESTSDLLALYEGKPGKHVGRFTVTAELPACFDQSQMKVTFFALPRPAAIAPDLAAQLRAPLEFPMANRVPSEVVPPRAPFRLPSGLLVLRTETPAHLTFALDGTERAVSYDYGLDPETYLRGKTDGVEFVVELQQPGGPVQVLDRQMLRPLTVEADRGRHQKRVVLPPVIKPGSRLTLRADPGPERDNSWDWAYYAKIRLQSGPLILEQFPGFNVAPADVAADYCGPLVRPDGHSVFMLNAVGHLGFALHGGEHSLRFTGGLLEGAYTEGNSDGVEFVVELQRADGRTEPLSRRWLQPKTVAADRGPQSFAMTLPDHHRGDRLVISTLGGPAGNLAWDWSYLSDLELR